MRNEISERLIDFAAANIRLVEQIPIKSTAKKLSDQLVRSSTSVGPNYEEAQGAESRKDFVHKLQGETAAWEAQCLRNLLGEPPMRVILYLVHPMYFRMLTYLVFKKIRLRFALFSRETVQLLVRIR